MDFITSDKLKHHPDRVAEYLKTGYSRPITAQFQITNVCPYRCVYCDKVLNDIESEVTDKFISTLKNLGILSIVLTGGEPVVYKKFDKDIPILAENFELGLVTTLCKYQPLLETHFKWVKVSMDSIDEKIFKEIRQGGGLSTILKNLEKLYKNKSSTVALGTQIVLTNENKSMDLMTNFIERVKDICDYIQIRPIESSLLYEYTAEDFNNLKILKDKYKKITISDKFSLNQKPKSCPARWSQILINSEHEVMLCCNRSTEKIASLYDKNLLEKLKTYNLDTRRCFRSCVLSSQNKYLSEIGKGNHINFV